jgi:hypothetical protein
MVKAMRVCLFLFIVSTAAATAVSAQALADVARQESHRRQAVQDSGKTYTNQDLKPVPSAPADAPPAADAAPADAATTDAGGADVAQGDAGTGDSSTVSAGRGAETGNEGDAREVKDQAYWSQRLADLRERLDRDQTFAEALQNRIDALTTDFVNRDDPAQRAQISGDRQKALTELERVKKNIEQDKRAIPELEDEARRAGAPAGWLRQ